VVDGRARWPLCCSLLLLLLLLLLLVKEGQRHDLMVCGNMHTKGVRAWARASGDAAVRQSQCGSASAPLNQGPTPHLQVLVWLAAA
jgi:hypothetical protein